VVLSEVHYKSLAALTAAADALDTAYHAQTLAQSSLHLLHSSPFTVKQALDTIFTRETEVGNFEANKDWRASRQLPGYVVTKFLGQP
jgi:hypothetical protein